MKRQEIILAVAVVTVILAAAFHFLIAPVAEQNDTLDKRIKQSQAKLSRYQWLLGQKDRLESRYRQLNAAENFLSPAKDAVVAAFQELENLAQKSGVRIVDIRPANPAESDASRENAINLKAEADMESYFKFIYDVEHSLSLLKIKSLQLNAKAGTGLLDGDFLISQFFLPD
ncbi:MAG TPA: type II secretion system protein GspM [Patescibacteria group bacterium]|nr:type II secretion system protein GspM [Patescibacteria group bacterium]